MATHPGVKGISLSNGWSTGVTGIRPGRRAALYCKKKKWYIMDLAARSAVFLRAGRHKILNTVYMGDSVAIKSGGIAVILTN
jgi:hypothetical protein